MDPTPDQPNGSRPQSDVPSDVPSGPPPDWAARQRTVRNIWTIRWVLMGLSAVLAIALIASGAVFLGLLLAAVAVVRLVMMMLLMRRRRDLRDRRNPPGPDPGFN
jgi:fatty acid desaturase